MRKLLSVAFLIAVSCSALAANSNKESSASELLVKQCKHVLQALAKKPETLQFHEFSSEISNNQQHIRVEFSVEKLKGLPILGTLTCSFAHNVAKQSMTHFTLKRRGQETPEFKPSKFPKLSAGLARIREGLDP